MDTHLHVAEIVANILDNRFRVGGVRFGIAAFLDLIPEVGDVLIFFSLCILSGLV